MPTSQDSPLVFSADELDLIGRTADALSAYMGKPVLAEVINADETGFEWAIFAVPLDIEDDPKDLVVVQIGGSGAKIVGNQGGLTIAEGDVFDCEYLWAIQLSDLEGVRFIKVDQEGEEIAWSENLRDVLPFVMTDEAISDDIDDNDDFEDDSPDDDNDVFDPNESATRRTLH
ncbi:hypothetical protein EKL30_18345 [Candidimonas sp. SYP-B2681]|uniref:hypothetical protein n=1 Tax=Candidimonas sp. SYP-B2681 TaxID=2497686 RepID=UPI000F89BED9|nr:hypothetical protein [Candidimonas sp. SYP-B2681]RTZ39173.1 hypothetical protein EKL30_18345 [Candidimonas sp. SYP-B2681]